jgi:hypothetical protein
MTAQRERLPNRRASTVFDFEAGGLRYTATTSATVALPRSSCRTTR